MNAKRWCDWRFGAWWNFVIWREKIYLIVSGKIMLYSGLITLMWSNAPKALRSTKPEGFLHWGLHAPPAFQLRQTIRAVWP